MGDEQPVDDNTNQFLHNKMAYRAGLLFANSANLETTRDVNMAGDGDGRPPTRSRRERLQHEVVLDDVSQRLDRWKAIEESQRRKTDDEASPTRRVMGFRRNLQITTESEEVVDMCGGK